MALQTFDQAMQHDREPFTVFIGDSEFHGYAASTRIDRKTVPDGWYVYDLRHDDYGEDVCEIKNAYISVNHFASFYTQNKLPLKKGESLFRGSDLNEFDYIYDN